MNILHFIGLDLAATTGYCHINIHLREINVCELKSRAELYENKVQDIYSQILEQLFPLGTLDTVIGIEQFVYFAKSRVTQSQLCGFFGYVYHSLVYQKYKTISVPIASARKKIRPKDIKNNKKEMQDYLNKVFGSNMTNNETDALTIALSLLPESINWEFFELRKIK